MLGCCPLGDPIFPTVSQGTGNEPRPRSHVVLAETHQPQAALSAVRNLESWPGHPGRVTCSLCPLPAGGMHWFFLLSHRHFSFQEYQVCHYSGRKSGVGGCGSWWGKKEGGAQGSKGWKALRGRWWGEHSGVDRTAMEERN